MLKLVTAFKWCVAIGSLLFVTNASGQAYLPVDKGSKVEFTVGTGSKELPKIKGQLSGLAGTIVFDPTNLAKASFDITLNAATATSADKVADSKVKSEAYLNVGKYPQIRIKSRRVKQDRPGSIVYVLEGDLTLKGVTRPVSVQFTTSPRGNGLLFRGVLHLNRLTYGVGGKNDADALVAVFLEVLARKK